MGSDRRSLDGRPHAPRATPSPTPYGAPARRHRATARPCPSATGAGPSPASTGPSIGSPAALLEAGLVRGDRLGALGRNSDAYLILWLACAPPPARRLITSRSITPSNRRETAPTSSSNPGPGPDRRSGSRRNAREALDAATGPWFGTLFGGSQGLDVLRLAEVTARSSRSTCRSPTRT